MAVQIERLFCWTVCAYRKPGMSEQDYHKYMSEVHAPLVRDLMVKYGIVTWEMVSGSPRRGTLPARDKCLQSAIKDPQHIRD